MSEAEGGTDSGGFKAFADLIDGREAGSESTVDKYVRWCRRYESWASTEHDEQALRDFDAFLEDENRIDYPWSNSRGPSAPNSYAHRTRLGALSATKLWHKHHYDVDVSSYTDVQNIALGEPADFEPELLDQREIRQIQRNASLACDNDDCHAAVRLGYDLVMRGAELADVRYEDFDFNNQSVYVRAKKGSEQKHISVSDDVWSTVAQHARQHSNRDHLYRNAYGRAWTPAAWNQHFRREHEPVGFHAYARHSKIVQMLKNGKEFGEVYLRSRHSNPSTTIKYVGFVPDMDAPEAEWIDG